MSINRVLINSSPLIVLLKSLLKITSGKLDLYSPCIRDLRRMKPKTLTQVEAGILAGELDQVELGIQADQKAAECSQAIKTGVSWAKKRGTHVGRRTETDEELELFISSTINLFHKSYSLFCRSIRFRLNYSGRGSNE